MLVLTMDDKPNNLGAWLRFVGVVIGGVISIMVALINNSDHSQKERPARNHSTAGSAPSWMKEAEIDAAARHIAGLDSPPTPKKVQVHPKVREIPDFQDF
jgi:hypothetical protein